MSKEIPLVILSSLVLFVCANDMMLDREAVNVISRSDGFVLLAFFLIFMRYTFAIARNGADEAGEEQKIKEMLYGNRCCILQEGWPDSYSADSFLSTGQAGLPVHGVSVNR